MHTESNMSTIHTLVRQTQTPKPKHKIKTGKTVTYLRNDLDLEKLAIKNSIEKIQNIEFKNNKDFNFDKNFINQCYELYDLIKSIDGDHEILEQLVIIGAFTTKEKKIFNTSKVDLSLKTSC